MSTWMCLAVVSSVLPVSLGQTLRTVQTCTNSTSESLKLTCETREIIHVVSVQYQNMTGSCESPTYGGCVFLQETQADSLYTECNGVTRCDMEVHKFWIDTICGDTTNYKTVITYECIIDNPIDVCDNVTQLSRQNINRLYLASPNYPRLNIASSGTCSCDVTGHNMSVTVLEYFFLPVEGVRANLTVTGDTSTWESFTAGMLGYNSLVMNNTDSLRVVFDAIPTLTMKKEIMWLKVEGSSAIQVACNGSPPPPSILSATTHPTTNDTGDSDVALTVVSVVCGVAILLLLAIVVAVLLYIKVVKRLRSSASPDQANEEPTCIDDHVIPCRAVSSSDVADTTSTPRIYCGLSPYSNLDHEYGSLHVYSVVGCETPVRAVDNV
ncbi:uncharacterized protein [Haliotis asinina]|uniref:uncharacterized protein n=1 Tax=Haliotis asinina TaxID=109174 RepID=UPI00353187FF